MATFHDVALKVETGWAMRVNKTILETRNASNKHLNLMKHVYRG